MGVENEGCGGEDVGLFFDVGGFETGAGGFEVSDRVGGGEEVVFCFRGVEEGMWVDEGSGGLR